MLSIGNLLRRDEIGTVPNNAIVVNNAPQLELLKKASVCITHGGFNTVLEALTQGVPQIAIPVTNDQPGVAARIEYKKTGKTTSLDGWIHCIWRNCSMKCRRTRYLGEAFGIPDCIIDGQRRDCSNFLYKTRLLRNC